MPEKITQNFAKYERKRMSDVVLYGLGFTLATLAGIDFTIHHNAAMSDPDIREFFYNLLGPIINYVGNFGFAAASGITLGAVTKILSRANKVEGDETPFEHALTGFSKLGAVSVLATVLAIEAFTTKDGFNRQFFGDFGMTLGGFYSGKLEVEELLHRLHAGRQDAVRGKVDAFHYLANVPTSVDQIFPN